MLEIEQREKGIPQIRRNNVFEYFLTKLNEFIDQLQLSTGIEIGFTNLEKRVLYDCITMLELFKEGILRRISEKEETLMSENCAKNHSTEIRSLVRVLFCIAMGFHVLKKSRQAIDNLGMAIAYQKEYINIKFNKSSGTHLATPYYPNQKGYTDSKIKTQFEQEYDNLVRF